MSTKPPATIRSLILSCFSLSPAFWPSFCSPSAVLRLIATWERLAVLLISWLQTGITAAGLPLCISCLLIASAAVVGVAVVSGNTSIHGAIFSHEAKVLYSSSNRDLNSPDSCIHCRDPLYGTLCPSLFCSGTNKFWFSLFAAWKGSSTVFFLLLLFNLDCINAEGCKEPAKSNTD